MTEQLTTKDVADSVGTTSTRLRVFLRASEDYVACGAGNKYSFTKKDLPALKKRFKAWAEKDTTKRTERAARIEAERAAKVQPGDTTPAPDGEDLDDLVADATVAEMTAEAPSDAEAPVPARDLDFTDTDTDTDNHEAATA